MKGGGRSVHFFLFLVGAKDIIPCRTLDKLKVAIESIKKSVSTADLVAMHMDLSDLPSVKRFTESYFVLDLPLHFLINNASTMVFHI